VIVCHSKKFIFFKPVKVAGTSIEAMLSDWCGPDDLITGPGIEHYNESLGTVCDNGNVFKNYVSRNNIDESNGKSRFHNHISPDLLYKKTKSKWDDYTKISVIRNPWDMCVSYLWWSLFKKSWKDLGIDPVESDTNIDLIRKFRIFLFTEGTFPDVGYGQSDQIMSSLDWLSWSSNKFYTDDMDYLIRYENLEEDARVAFSSVGVEFDTLPRFKTNVRKLNTHYSNYYDPFTINLIEFRFDEMIKKFGYKFKNK